MAITSVKVGPTASQLELIGATYNVDRETLYALTAGTPKEPRLVAMAGRHPAYVGETPTARTIPLVVYMKATTEATRRTDWASLVAKLDSSSALVDVRWTDGGTTLRYWCAVTDATASADFSVATANLVAPDPVSETP
jgi:hypothetical protein